MKETIYITGRSQKTEVRRQRSEDRSQKTEVRSGQSQSQSQKAKAKAEPARTTWSEGAGSRKPEVRSASAALCVTFVSSVVNHRESQRTHDLSDRVVRADLSQYSVIAKEPQSVTRNLQPAGSVQEAGMFARRGEMAAQRCEMFAQWSEMAVKWIETATQWTETATQRSEMATQWDETTVKCVEMATQQSEMTTQQSETGGNIPVRCTFGAHRISLATNIAGALHLRSIPEGLYVYSTAISRIAASLRKICSTVSHPSGRKVQRTETGKESQKSEVRSWKTEARSPKPEAGSNIPVRCTSGVVRISLATNIAGALHLGFQTMGTAIGRIAASLRKICSTVSHPSGRKVQRTETGKESQKSEVRSQKPEVGSRKSEVRSQKSEVGSQKSEVRSQKLEVGSPKPEARRNIPVRCTFGVNRIFLATNIIGALHLQPGTLNFKPATLNLLAACGLQLAAFLLLVTRSSKLEAKNISVTSYPSTANSGSVCNLSSNRCPAAAAITAISVLAAVGALWIYRHQFLTSPAARAQQKGGMWMRSE